MLINLGRLLMLCVWAFLVLNLFQPFPRPLNIFVNVALVFMVLMHGMQMALLQSTIPKDGPQMTKAEKVRIFLFGVFELLVWQKKSRRRRSNVRFLPDGGDAYPATCITALPYLPQTPQTANLCSSARLCRPPSAHDTARRRGENASPARPAPA